MVTKERESNFELLRVFAMFSIVLYHLILESSKAFGYAEIRTLQLPLHIGVPLFVLISGYFHIRPSFKGLAKLLLPLFAFYVPIELCSKLLFGGECSIHIICIG